MHSNELNETKKFVKKLAKKLKKEGSTTAGVPGYLTPNAFVGDSKAKGSKAAMNASTAYTIEPSKKKRFFVGYKDQGVHINEANYKEFKEDASIPNHKKINQAILEINRKISEISKLLEHSIKLKTEAQVGDEKLWKKTNEALLKIYKRLNEATKRTRTIANLKEIETNSVKDRFLKILTKTGILTQAQDIEVIKQGNVHIIDATLNGEPYGFDLENDMLTYQGFDQEVELGNINREQEVVDNLKKILQAG